MERRDNKLMTARWVRFLGEKLFSENFIFPIAIPATTWYNIGVLRDIGFRGTTNRRQ